MTPKGEIEIEQDGGISELNWIKKVAKPVLFTTTDGKDIREGDSYWYINPTWEIFCNISASKTIKCGTHGGQFSTKEAANEWVIENKPCMSLKDVYGICTKFENIDAHVLWPNFEVKFKELAKSKING